MIQRNDLYPLIIEKFVPFGEVPVKIFHIRNESDQSKDIFNDWLGFIDAENNVWLSVGTTDPGIHAEISHPSGPAHAMLGFHRDVWVIDTHAANNKRFAHEALCSRFTRGCAPIKYFRDVNKNKILDANDVIREDYVGINCHRASAVQDVQVIGLYGEGCQVRQNKDDHEFMMQELKKFKCVQDSLRDGVYTYKFSFLLSPIAEFNNLL